MAKELAQDAEDVGLSDDQVVLTIDLDLGAVVLAEQDAVALLDGELTARAVVAHLAGADRDDGRLGGLLFGAVGVVETTLGLGL